MSTNPSEGLWVELTCDGNRRARAESKQEEGDRESTSNTLSDDDLYQCYKMGGEATKKIIEVSRDQSVGLIAVWAWSTKNWKRGLAQKNAVFQVTTEFLHDLEQNWIDLPENENVRLVHMGRSERLIEEAPEMMDILHRISGHTRERCGMVVALMMDYSGPDEERRARSRWIKSRLQGQYEDYLDLPVQGVGYRELDLRIRTGETTHLKHLNAVMRAYEGMETREAIHALYLPEYTPELYIADLNALFDTEKREGE